MNIVDDFFIPDLLISGGQRGADIGGLQGARDAGIGTGGYAPKGWRTEDGPRPDLADYGLIEHVSDRYDARTVDNVMMSDAVIMIARNFQSPGTDLTAEVCRRNCKPKFEVPYPTLPKLENPDIIADVRSWLAQIRPGILMIAGNRESKARGIEAWTRKFTLALLTRP